MCRLGHREIDKTITYVRICYMKKLLLILFLVFLYSKAFAEPTFVDSFSVNSEEDEPRGITFNNNGTKMFVIGWRGDDVNEYTLSTAWDVSTASFVDSTSRIDADGRDVRFNPDGTKMFVLGRGSDKVYAFSLSTAFDISTSSSINNFSVTSEEEEANGLAFNLDGTKMYVVGEDADYVNEYTLSKGFDLSTASYAGDSERFLVSGQDSIPIDIDFNSDGTKMYVVGWDGSDINEYTLSTAFDVSTASFEGSFSVATEDANPAALAFSSDAAKMFVVGAAGEDVNEYTLSCYYGVVNCMDPTSDKDDVASVEVQTESAKELIQHTTYPVLNRMEWLRRNSNSANLTNQNIKFQFSNEILASLSNLIIPTYLSSNNSLTTELQSSGNWSYWSEGTISVGKVGDSLTSSAKNINTTAITIGADKSTDNGRMFGVALRFGNDDIDFGNVKNSLDMDAVSLTLYDTRPHGEGKFIDSLIGIGTFKTDIVNAVGSTSTEGTRDGKQIFSSFKIRETFKKNELNITPKIKLDLGFTSLSDYSESGSTNLKFDKQNIGTIITSIGGAVDNSSNLKNGTFKPYFEYDYFLDISPSSEQKISYISDTGSTYTLSNINSSTHNFKSKLGFDYITDAGWDITASYQRTQSKESGYSDALYFGANYISRRNTEYAMSLDNNKAFLDYKRNINGFDITFGSNYTLMSAIPDYGATIEVSSKF